MTEFPLCIKCKNFSPKSNKERQFCRAFPEQIPKEIWNSTILHFNSYTGDNGITFEDNGNLVQIEILVS